MATVTERRGRLGLGTIRGRSLWASLALLVLLATVALLGVVRASHDRSQHETLQRKSVIVAELQEARAQIYLSSALLTSAIFSPERVSLVHSAQEALANGQASVAAARDAMIAENDHDMLSRLQTVDARLDQLTPTLEALITAPLNTDTETVQALASAYLPEVWPEASAVWSDLGEIASSEQQQLTGSAAQANHEADVSLWLLAAFGSGGFLVAVAVLMTLMRSVVGPLSSLQRSVRAVASGDMESRAAVSGPEEVASLAADFNAMVGQLNVAAAQMQHRLNVESAVARTSALLDTAEDMDLGLNSALEILAEAVDAEHSYIFMFNDGNTKMENTHEWNAAGKIAAKDRFSNLDCATYSWWVGKLMRNEEVILQDIAQLPAEAAAEADILGKMNAKCALAVPFGPAGKPTGFVGFGDRRECHVWREEDVRLLRLASESISSFINRRNTEQALRESEERFRSLSASSPIGIFLADDSGRWVYVNEQLLSISNLPLDQALGVGWMKIIHPDDQAGVVEEKERSNRENDQFSRDFRIVTPGGEVRWVNMRSKPAGRLGSRVGTLEDITERKQAEDALRQSEERFRTLGASAPIGIFRSDAAGKVVFVNKRFVEIAGESFGEESKRNWYDVVHPEDRNRAMGEVIEAIKARQEFAWDFRLSTPQRTTRWVSARARDMRDKNGRFIGLMGTIEDITERREGEEALRQSEERFRSLSASAPIGIFLTDADDLVTYANDRMRRIIGAGREERLENSRQELVATSFVHPDDRQLVFQAHLEASNHEVYDFSREFRIITRQGELRWVRVHVIPILSGEAVQTGRVGTVEDITEHKNLEQERQRAYERTTLLLAMAAEARDPYTEHHLFRIRGYSEAIALQMELSPEAAKEIGLASLLHDLGKTRIPDAILTKPGPLTPDEWQIMRRHPVWGEELLPDSPWFTTARQIARYHHENWDGSGYPDGLKAETIPLAAAIVAVADGFDAMTSKRPYKGAWPPARAMRELKAATGRRYCPEVVEAFERAVAEGAIARIASVRRSNLSDLMKAA